MITTKHTEGPQPGKRKPARVQIKELPNGALVISNAVFFHEEPEAAPR